MNTLELLALLAIIDSALFAGAAFYVSFAEQPARLGLNNSALLAEWKPSYSRGYAMQAPLALLGFVFGATVWWFGGGAAFLAGALLMLANWPWTLLVIGPVNARLYGASEVDPQVRPLIVKWGRLHAVRTVFGVCAVAAFLLGLMNQ